MAAYEAAGETDEWYTPRYIFDALGERFATKSEARRALQAALSKLN